MEKRNVHIVDQIAEELLGIVSGDKIPPWFSSIVRRVELICVEMRIYVSGGYVKFRVVRLEGSGILSHHYCGGDRNLVLGNKHLISVKSLCDVLKSRSFGSIDAASNGDQVRLIGTHTFSLSCSEPCEIEIAGSISYDMNYIGKIK